MATKYTGNNNSNKFTGPDDREAYEIYGYGGNDTLIGNGENDSIYAGADKDVLKGKGGDDYLEGGTGNDTITGGDGEDIFVYSAGDGNDVITDYKSGEDKILFKSGTPKFKEVGSDVVITVGTGKITVKGAAGGVITYIDKNGKEKNWPNTIDIDDDTNTVTLAKGYKRDSFNLVNYDDDIQTIDASAVTQELEITGNSNNNKIIGTVGEDTIDGGKGADTIDGGKGNDTLTGGKGSDVFVYTKGNGKDTILDYAEEDVIQFTSGTKNDIEAYTSGDDVILEYNKNSKVILKNAANKTVTYTVDGEEVTANFGETVKYNNKKTSATILASYTDDEEEFTATSKLVTINASAVESDLSIKGNKLTNKIVAGAGNDTLYGGKGNDTLTGGEGDDIFVYGSGDGNDVITDYENGDIISLTSGTVNYAGIKGNDLIYTVGKGRITVKGAPGENVKNVHFVNSSGEEFSLPYVPDELITISGNGKGATLTEAFDDDEINANTQPELKNFVNVLVTLDASAVDHEIAITGTKKANYIIGSEEDDTIFAGAGKDTVYGGDGDDKLYGEAGNDTLYGGKGSDTLYGGKGSDVFVYNKGDGKDVIADYTEGEDVIQFAAGAVSSVGRVGSDVIFKVGTGKVTVKNAKGKVVSYLDGDEEKTYPNTSPYTVNTSTSTVVITNKYVGKSFNINDYDELDDIRNIDATNVTGNFKITGNSKANKILGAAGNNTIIGGKGNDTLNGEGGANTYVYNNGDGNDLIIGWGSDDTLRIQSGNLSGDPRVKGDTVILTVGKGKISLQGAVGETVSYWYDGELESTIFGSSYNDNVACDDNFEVTPSNNLSSIVKSKAIDYSVVQADSSLSLTPKSNSTPQYTFAGKKK